MAVRRLLRRLLLVPVLALVCAAPASADNGPILHEQIPSDPREDLALRVALDGDLPVAIETKSGVVSAPDPRRPVSSSDPQYASSPPGDHSDASFTPDRNTKRPDVEGYDEPFTPSTAPFKRLEAFDTLSSTYQLSVRDPRVVPLPSDATPAGDGSEDQFFADFAVDVAPGQLVRIPSVGPGARIVRARLGHGADDIPFRIVHDGADNWFVEGFGGPARARLVMELTIPRAVFGGVFADARWADIPRIAPLPDNVQASAREVMAAIGVSQSMRPRDVVTKLVAYFRGFVDSDDPPRGRADIYLDLALSKKGVCRHRAFAFMVTAQSLGIPTRMVLNEAHAWVEVHDGVMWRRIDLGGAGRMVNPASNLVPERAVHQPPPDPFQWPQGSERGDDMVEQARERAREGPSAAADGGAGPAPSSSTSSSGTGDAGDTSMLPPSDSASSSPQGRDKDVRPPASVTAITADSDARRGAPLHVKGEITADGEGCSHVVVELFLRDVRDAKKLLLLGTAATNDDGAFDSAIVVPGTMPLGDYDVFARTAGDARCGRGSN
jgi:transglutaminase-like putative cysteine protease